VPKRTVFFVSDQTGVTAETMGHSLLTQFDGLEFRSVTLPFIATIDKAIEARGQNDATAAAEGVPPIVFCEGPFRSNMPSSALGMEVPALLRPMKLPWIRLFVSLELKYAMPLPLLPPV
jgi:regulator of PEP synthase PpsR (kinase-PPPase family)